MGTISHKQEWCTTHVGWLSAIRFMAEARSGTLQGRIPDYFIRFIIIWSRLCEHALMLSRLECAAGLHTPEQSPLLPATLRPAHCMLWLSVPRPMHTFYSLCSLCDLQDEVIISKARWCLCIYSFTLFAPPTGGEWVSLLEVILDVKRWTLLALWKSSPTWQPCSAQAS